MAQRIGRDAARPRRRARAPVGGPGRVRRAVRRRRGRARRGRAVPDQRARSVRTWRASRSSAAPPCASRWPARGLADEPVALGLLEPGRRGPAPERTWLEPVAGGHAVTGRKVGRGARRRGVAHRRARGRAAGRGARARRRRRAGVVRPQPAFDATVPLSTVEFAARPGGRSARDVRFERLPRSAGCSRPPRRSARPSRCSTTRATTRPSAASSAARSAATRRCATCWPTCTCARRAPGRPCSTPPPPSTTTPTARADRVDREGLRRARGARGRARRDPGVRWDRLHRRALAHRYLRRIVVRERQFGDAAAPRAALGRMLARGPRSRCADATGRASTTRPRSGSNGSRPAPSRTSSVRCSPTRCTTTAGATATSP